MAGTDERTRARGRRRAPARSPPELTEPQRRVVRGHARISAYSGILFALLFVAALVLVQQGPHLAAPDEVYLAFYAGADDVLATVGLYVVPFAGIAFLWHLASTRALFRAVPGGPAEPTDWLHQTAGVVFVCMMFTGTAAVGAVALLSTFSVTPLPSPEVARGLSGAGYGLVFVFGVRVAGMYMITTTSLARAAGLLPGWVCLLGYLAAAFLLVSTTFHPAVLLVFPAWLVVVAAVLLLGAARPRASAPHAPDPQASDPTGE